MNTIMLSENNDQDDNQGDQLSIPCTSFYKCVSQKNIEIHIFYFNLENTLNFLRFTYQ